MDCCCLGSIGCWLLTVGLVVLVGFFLDKKDPPKVAGVYSRPGKFYWVKVVVFYLLIKFRKWNDARKASSSESTRDHTNSSSYNAGYGRRSKTSPEDMERVQPLSSHFQAIDAIYFNGANDKGFSIVSGTARRPHGVVNGFLIFRIPELGYLVSPKFPDTILYGSKEKVDPFFGAEGFKYEPVVPMKHWKLEYNGQLKFLDDPNTSAKVSLRADWKSELDYFDFDSMMPTWTMAKAMSLESWSKEYFENLKAHHQTHYEQHGDLIGEIDVDGRIYKFRMPSMRDHSYGVKRDWKLLHRYNMHMFSLEDGRRFDIGMICHPCITSRLEMGYMYDFDGSLHALESVGHPLQDHGEGGSPPQDYGLTVKSTNGKTYHVQVQVLETQELHIGWEWEARIVERRCKFTVDGSVGYGISECMYRHMGGRPEAFAKKDPEWVKDVKTVE